MNRSLPFVLAAAVCAVSVRSAAAQTAENALATGYAGASAAASAALKDQRALDAKPDAKAAASASALKEFHLASNDSNSPEIYRALLAGGAKPVCKSDRVDDGGFPRVLEACSAVGTLDHVTVERNEIIWRSTEHVKVAGDVHCWQEWLAPGGVHPRPHQLWHFCDFRGTVEP